MQYEVEVRVVLDRRNGRLAVPAGGFVFAANDFRRRTVSIHAMYFCLDRMWSILITTRRHEALLSIGLHECECKLQAASTAGDVLTTGLNAESHIGSNAIQPVRCEQSSLCAVYYLAKWFGTSLAAPWNKMRRWRLGSWIHTPTGKQMNQAGTIYLCLSNRQEKRHKVAAFPSSRLQKS